MSFDQGELNFDGAGTTKGYQKWRHELDERKRAFELRFGVIVGCPVRVCLADRLKPLEGIIHLVGGKQANSAKHLQFELGGTRFNTRDIESIVRISSADSD